MIFANQRIAAFQFFVDMFGWPAARRVSLKWKELLRFHPELIADLAWLGGLTTPDRRPDGTPMCAEEMARQRGKREMVLAIFARAEIKEAEITQAIEEMNRADVSEDDMDDGYGAGTVR